MNRQDISLTSSGALLTLTCSALALFSAGCVVTEWMPSPQPTVIYQKADYSDPNRIIAGSKSLYQRAATSTWDSEAPSRFTQEERDLLTRFAPIIVHGYLDDEERRAGKKPEDAIGEPHLVQDKAKNKIEIVVNTENPVVYTDIRQAIYHSVPLTQLIYSFWYPDHPQGGIQKGHVDGRIVRVTLDSLNQVIAVDTSMHCGCFHGAFVSETVEEWAKEEFKILDPGANRFCERHYEDRIAWNVRGLLTGTNRSQPPVIYLTAGERYCEAIQFKDQVGGLEAIELKSYTMEDYDRLNNIHPDNAPDITASMFGREGLTHGGKRIGEEIFFPTMNHPGWPRSLDQVEIHWDQARFTDPYLLQTYLRLPQKVLE
jgi:hypothetical protein